jgi:hypothetical protein
MRRRRAKLGDEGRPAHRRRTTITLARNAAFRPKPTLNVSVSRSWKKRRPSSEGFVYSMEERVVAAPPLVRPP